MIGLDHCARRQTPFTTLSAARSESLLPAAVRDRLQRGFSLIEVLIAMVLLTLALVALLQTFTAASQSFTLSRRKWEATIEKWNRAQQIRSDPWESTNEMIPIPGSRPLSRYKLAPEERSENFPWEVLYAQK